MTRRRVEIAPWKRAGPWAAVPLLLLAGACASGASQGFQDVGTAPANDSEPSECVTGLVVSEGAAMAPRTLVRRDDGTSLEVLGVFAGNVRRLAGTTVQACGPGRTPDGSLEVTTVRVLEVDGMPAVLGTLRSVVSGWAVEPLPDGDLVLLADVPTRLQASEGEVVWVAGPTAGRALAVRSFAVLEGWR